VNATDERKNPGITHAGSAVVEVLEAG
jgi:hypothetical protein